MRRRNSKGHFVKGYKHTDAELLAMSKNRKGKLLGEKHFNWKGGRTKNYSGYILLKKSNNHSSQGAKYVREHRHIMEQHLGRKLKKTEEVHHINGKKEDNRIQNLEVMTKSQHSKISHLSRTRDEYGRYV